MEEEEMSPAREVTAGSKINATHSFRTVLCIPSMDSTSVSAVRDAAYE
jgi:hypothetical protein